MTVTKSRNLIANRNTGGNKKQGLAPSIGKSASIRQSQLVKASSNDKTVYCINQVGGIGRFRNQLSSADSTGCVSKVYNINSALNDSLDILKLHSDYLFAYILIYNRKFHNTHTYINTSSKSPHTFNYINFNINTPTNVQSDISFNNITLKGNDTKFLYKFSNNDYNFTEGYLNIIYNPSQNYNDISNNDVSLNLYGFLPNSSHTYSLDNENIPYDTYDTYGYNLKYYPFLYGSLHEYTTNFQQTSKLENNYFVKLFIHKN